MVPVCVMFRIWSVVTWWRIGQVTWILTERKKFLTIDQQYRLLIMHRYQFALCVSWSKNSVSYSLKVENTHKQPLLKLCIKSGTLLSTQISSITIQSPKVKVAGITKRVGGTAKLNVIHAYLLSPANDISMLHRERKEFEYLRRFSASWWSWWFNLFEDFSQEAPFRQFF